MRKYPINITIDTNIFDASKYDLTEEGVLHLLTKFVNEGKVKVYLSDIVIREAHSHLDEIGQSILSKIRDNCKRLLSILDNNAIEASESNNYLEILDKVNRNNLIWKSFEEYITSLNPVIFDLSLIDIEQTLNDYFEYKPPFEKQEKKRKEFPDAFIAKQIRDSFPNGDLVILSEDKGFIDACQKNRQYEILGSIGDLCNLINSQDENYQLVVDSIFSLAEEINKEIKETIESDGNILVSGQTVDRKGIISGFDYSETILSSVKNVTHQLHVVEDIKEDEAVVILDCTADVEMDCYYDDYDNAPWDSEEKEYVFVDSVHIVEKHNARFPVRAYVNYQNNNISIQSITIRLGSASRIERKVTDKRRKWEEPYNICPDCGDSISSINDGGNGFCIKCAPNH